MKWYQTLALVLFILALAALAAWLTPVGKTFLSGLLNGAIIVILWITTAIAILVTYCGAFVIGALTRTAIDILDDAVDPQNKISTPWHFLIAVSSSLLVGIIWLGVFIHVASLSGMYHSALLMLGAEGPFETMPIGIGIMAIAEQLLGYHTAGNL